MSWLQSYVGLPFRDGGRDETGCDCWGLVRLVYRRELGIELPSYGEIAASDLLRVTRAMMSGAREDDAWSRVPEARAFDVALMRRPDSASIGHVGVVVDAGHILHIEAASAAVVERMSAVTLRDRIVGFYRHREAGCR